MGVTGLGERCYGRLLLAAVLAVGAAQAANVTDADTGWWSLADGVLTLDNANADLSSSTNIYASAIGSGVKKIVKTGPGAVRLSGANGSFAGEIEVREGLLMGWVRETGGGKTTEDNYGAPTKVAVSDGATFEMLATPIENVAYTGSRFSNTQFHVQGFGVKDARGDMGALYRRSALQSAERSYATIKHLTLNGPTMLYVGMRWGFNGSGCTLNQNGHTLTLRGENTDKIFNFSREGTTTVTNPGDLVLDKVSLCNENYAPVAASGSSLAGATVVITNNSQYWGLARNNTGIGDFLLPYGIRSHGGMLTGPNAGDAANTRITATYAGDLALVSGTMTLRAYQSKGLAHLALTGHVDGNGTLATHDSDGNKLAYVTLTGGGAGERNTFAKLDVKGGRVALTGGAIYDITNTAVVAGASRTDKFLARLVVTNALLRVPTAMDGPGATGYGNAHIVKVGCSDSKFGIVELGTGAVVTNDFRFGELAKGGGALYMSGDAKLYWHGGGGSNPFLGSAGYAYLGLRDNAVLENLGYFNVGSSGGRTFVIQRGGTYRNAPCGLPGHSCSVHTTAFKIGRTNGEAHYYQCGGTQWSAGSVWFTWDYATNVHTSRGSFTVDGTADSEVNDICFCISLAGTPDYNPDKLGTYGHVNVNGGTLKASHIYKTIQTGFSLKDGTKASWANTKNLCPNTWGFVNFDGGVLKVKGTGDFFSSNGTAEDARLPTRVTVYAGGATIDTDVDSTWRLPLEKPYGLGVKRIVLPASVRTDTGYLGPAWIKFAGDGSNTTAIVDFDETTRTNRGVFVTSAGFGYTAKPTVSIETSAVSGAFTTVAADDVEMVDFDAPDYVPGGLTKRGTGTLTLAAANTYGGATRVEGGTLAFTRADGFPGGDLEFTAAAATNCAAPRVTAPALSFRPGAKLRIADADRLDRDQVHGVQTLVRVTTPLAELPAVEYVDADGEALILPSAWILRLGSGGTTVEFAYSRGTAILFR